MKFQAVFGVRDKFNNPSQIDNEFVGSMTVSNVGFFAVMYEFRLDLILMKFQAALLLCEKLETYLLFFA